MKELNYKDVLFDTEDAILNTEYMGFEEDYLVLHSLIRKFKPASYGEIGTNMGAGLNIACNAMSKHIPEVIMKDCIFSLDLPTHLAHKSLQHPISEGKGDRVGEKCKFPYTQLRGDSLTFDYWKYPCEAWFCDGEHDYSHVFIEGQSIKQLQPYLIIWHDSDMKEVMEGILAVFENSNYDLFRVLKTRITYAVRNNNN